MSTDWCPSTTIFLLFWTPRFGYATRTITGCCWPSRTSWRSATRSSGCSTSLGTLLRRVVQVGVFHSKAGNWRSWWRRAALPFVLNTINCLFNWIALPFIPPFFLIFSKLWYINNIIMVNYLEKWYTVHIQHCTIGIINRIFTSYLFYLSRFFGFSIG